MKPVSCLEYAGKLRSKYQKVNFIT